MGAEISCTWHLDKELRIYTNAQVLLKCNIFRKTFVKLGQSCINMQNAQTVFSLKLQRRESVFTYLQVIESILNYTEMTSQRIHFNLQKKDSAISTMLSKPY